MSIDAQTAVSLSSWDITASINRFDDFVARRPDLCVEELDDLRAALLKLRSVIETLEKRHEH